LPSRESVATICKGLRADFAPSRIRAGEGTDHSWFKVF
jgi:hypothetical protein